MAKIKNEQSVNSSVKNKLSSEQDDGGNIFSSIMSGLGSLNLFTDFFGGNSSNLPIQVKATQQGPMPTSFDPKTLFNFENFNGPISVPRTEGPKIPNVPINKQTNVTVPPAARANATLNGLNLGGSGFADGAGGGGPGFSFPGTNPTLTPSASPRQQLTVYDPSRGDGADSLFYTPPTRVDLRTPVPNPAPSPNPTPGPSPNPVSAPSPNLTPRPRPTPISAPRVTVGSERSPDPAPGPDAISDLLFGLLAPEPAPLRNPVTAVEPEPTPLRNPVAKVEPVPARPPRPAIKPPAPRPGNAFLDTSVPPPNNKIGGFSGLPATSLAGLAPSTPPVLPKQPQGSRPTLGPDLAQILASVGPRSKGASRANSL